ncbi:PREDICTED: DNA-binding protein K10-like [Branchiostoma belcheri]|uniref:DNA-binding protein K10-like n=1 Tax=Branchiostoma belcheri TaxID=7741 RepID=A0A6P4YST2_BRABE|nr:PREDICTED: DNA-binding protein K10-like [Branchiostoma belcheri]
MQQFSNPSQMFPNLPPNAQFPNMSQRFPNPSQQPFPSQQQQFSNMSQQRFPPSSSPNFQSPFPNTSSPNASMAAFINQMQNSAAKAAMSNNANVPPHVLNMREGGRGMNEGPSPLASLSNQVGQVPQPPMPPGMGQQRSPGPNKQQAMPPVSCRARRSSSLRSCATSRVSRDNPLPAGGAGGPQGQPRPRGWQD